MKQKIPKIGLTENGITSKVLLNGKFNITLFAFDKNQELSTHTSAFPALVQVQEGKIQITLNGKKEILGKNEMIFLPAGKPHAVKATTKAKMLLFLAK